MERCLPGPVPSVPPWQQWTPWPSCNLTEAPSFTEQETEVEQAKLTHVYQVPEVQRGWQNRSHCLCPAHGPRIHFLGFLQQIRINLATTKT